MKSTIVLSVLITLFGINFTMAQKYETQAFNVIQQYDEAELRFYPPVMKIQSNGDFGSLFRYISGGNESGTKIAMTTPVQMGNTSGEPVMQFVLPAVYNKDNTPKASSPNVTVLESETGYYLATQYGGYSMNWREKKAAKKLKEIAANNGLEISGEPILLVYNSPFDVFNRKNEVLYKVIRN